MQNLITSVQMLMLLPAMVLVFISWRTSRRLRSRHHMLVALGCGLGGMAVVLSLFTFALSFESSEPEAEVLSYGPAFVVLCLCVWVVQRGLVMPGRRSSG